MERRNSAALGHMSTLLAEAALMTGWLSITLNRRGAAKAYLSLAHDAADEAENRVLQAYALASMSTLASLTVHATTARLPRCGCLSARTGSCPPMPRRPRVGQRSACGGAGCGRGPVELSHEHGQGRRRLDTRHGGGRRLLLPFVCLLLGLD